MLKFRDLFILLALMALPHVAAADISDVRVVGDGAPTRITIWSDTAQSARAFVSLDSGLRTLILPLNGGADARSGTGTGGIAAWAASDSELRFSLDRPLMVTRVLTLPPTGSEQNHRVIIDLETVSDARFASVAKRDMKQLARMDDARVSTEVRREVASTRPDPLPFFRPKAGGEKFVIVVDSGHGGKDPGTQAKSGLKEKDVVLPAALELKKLLEADPRYEVRLTRETDVFIELEDRVTLARNWGANLFISLHADAAGKSSVSGASVYTISARGEARIDKEASKNDWRIPLEDGTPRQVSEILQDLVKRETKTHSAEFAELLLPELQKAGPVLRNTHRNAGLYVLLAPDVPAVLLELGFLSNEEDAKRLDSESGRKKSMKAVKAGIDKFFERQALLTASE